MTQYIIKKNNNNKYGVYYMGVFDWMKVNDQEFESYDLALINYEKNYSIGGILHD